MNFKTRLVQAHQIAFPFVRGFIFEDAKRLIGEESNYISEPYLVAHDLLEHVNGLNSIGTITDELQALGACFFGRYGYQPDLTPKAFIDAITQLAEYVSDNSKIVQHELSSIPKNDDHEFIIDNIPVLDVLKAVSQNCMELKSRTIEKFTTYAFANMFIGYEKAKNLYGDSETLHDLFVSVRDEFSLLSPRLDEDECLEYDVNINKGDTTVKANIVPFYN